MDFLEKEGGRAGGNCDTVCEKRKEREKLLQDQVLSVGEMASDSNNYRKAAAPVRGLGGLVDIYRSPLS